MNYQVYNKYKLIQVIKTILRVLSLRNQYYENFGNMFGKFVNQWINVTSD